MAIRSDLQLSSFIPLTVKKVIILALLLIATATSFAQRTIRVLAIGNSFSEDALEQHLYPIAKADSTIMIIGNLYIGGCSVDMHVNNIRRDAPAYSYRKIGADGIKVTRSATRLSEAITDEKWDYVSVQQVSGLSGIGSSYKNLWTLVDWVRSQAPQAQVVFHQTWAYASDSKHKDFPRYGNSQAQMSAAIYQTTLQAVVHNEDTTKSIKTVIPCLRSISCARQFFAERSVTRDGFHLNMLYGRYIAAATWYGALTGRKVVGNKYCPNGMRQKDLLTSQICADRANTPYWQIVDTLFCTHPASYIDGTAAFEERLMQEIQFPKSRGTAEVKASFAVENDGHISQITIEGDTANVYATEVLRALTLLLEQRWTPATLDGINIATVQHVAVSFRRSWFSKQIVAKTLQTTTPHPELHNLHSTIYR